MRTDGKCNDKLKFVGHNLEVETMKLLTQTIVLAIAMAISTSAMAQSPENATRQRKATTNVTTEAATQATPGDQTTPVDGPLSEPTPATTVPANPNGDKTKSQAQSKPLSEVTADG